MIWALLSKSEMAHFSDLHTGAGLFKSKPSADAAQKRERIITCLESVLPNEQVRSVIGDHEVWVEARKPLQGRWRVV